MSFLQLSPAEFRAPETEVLPDSRHRLTRFIKLTHRGLVPADLDVAYGTADAGMLPSGWTTLRLINKVLRDAQPAPGKESHPWLELIYEELPATAEIQVGENTVIQLEDGRTGIEANFLQFSSASATPGTVGTTTAPGDTSAFLQREEAPDDGCLRRIKRTYVYAGTLQQTDETMQGGMALRRTIISAKTVPSTPSGYTLILEKQDPVNGFPVYTYTFSKGLGLVAVLIASRSDGLREVTYISLGTRQAPDGIIIRDDYREADGYRIYTVSAMQAADGDSDPTTATLTFERNMPFRYPGRAKVYSETVNDTTFLDLFQSPPQTTKVKATITITYQTSNAIGTLAETLWNPSTGATVRAAWVGQSRLAQNVIRALPDYRSVDETPVEATSDFFAPPFGANLSCMGAPVYGGGTVANVVCYGGPPDPGGSTWTLDSDIELAFTATDGTKYFRKTIITAAIPAQDALPV